MPKIKNIIIFIVIGAIFVLIYIFFIKPSTSSDTASLVSTSAIPAPTTSSATTSGSTPSHVVAQDFLDLLLNTQSIKLDSSIFSDNAFISLHDSSITLTPDGTEGRSNPFAPIGVDVATAVTPTCTLPQVLDTVKNTCVTPPPLCTLPKILNPTTNTCVTPASH